MSVENRRENRVLRVTGCIIAWSNSNGPIYSASATILNESARGLALECSVPLSKDTQVYIEAQGGYPIGYATVRHCTQAAANFVIGLELQPATNIVHFATAVATPADYYEFLQISPNAQREIIQRVYQFLAGRYHPDNHETGDPEKFRLLNEAYKTLSNPEHRARYDARFKLSKTAARFSQTVECGQSAFTRS